MQLNISGRWIYIIAAILYLPASTFLAASDGMVRRENPAFDAALADYRDGDFQAAFQKWLSLARDGDPAAMRNIGHLYHHGQGPAQNFTEAVNWYKRAAETGLARAQANLADMLARGQGLEPDPRQAARWFLAAAARGHVISQYRIGLHYLRGHGVKRNPRAALFWFRLAIKAGYDPALVLLPQALESLRIATITAAGKSKSGAVRGQKKPK